MRQVISTALVAVIVSLLTVTAVGVLAQNDPAAERAITPAAGINAASVDGRSAVGYTSKRGRRAGKLVATNAKGELPSNIVRPYWGFIRNKPGILADHQISWGEVKNKPAGFADGSDDVGWASEVVYSGHLAQSKSIYITIDLDKQLEVQFSLIPVTVGAELLIGGNATFMRLPGDQLRHTLLIGNNGAHDTDFHVRARLFGTKAQLAGVVKGAKVSISSKPAR